MTNRAEQNKQELIDRVAERVNQRLEKDRAKLAEQFARLLYSNIPPDDIKEESADNLYGAALSLLNFADQRKAGTAKVRVYNPRIEEQGWRSSHTIVEINTDDMPFLVDSVTADLGVLASAGCAQVPVARRPRVATIGTGSELVPVDAQPHPGAIRNSNNAALIGHPDGRTAGGGGVRHPGCHAPVQQQRAGPAHRVPGGPGHRHRRIPGGAAPAAPG